MKFEFNYSGAKIVGLIEVPKHALFTGTTPFLTTNPRMKILFIFVTKNEDFSVFPKQYLSTYFPPTVDFTLSFFPIAVTCYELRVQYNSVDIPYTYPHYEEADADCIEGAMLPLLFVPEFTLCVLYRLLSLLLFQY